MSTFFQQGLQQGINLYNQAAQRARQAELDAIDKTRIEVLNKATEMQIKQAESAMELGELKIAEFKRKMDKAEEERVYARAVDEFWSARRFDHTAENANDELNAIIQNPPEGVPINNPYWRETIQNERVKIDEAKEVQYTNKAIDIVSKLKGDVDSVFGIGGELSTEEASNMLSRLSSAMANPYVMQTPFAAKSIANIATILSNHVSREFQQQGMFNERIGKLGSEISNTARQLNEALEDSLDPSLAEELRGHLSLLISERQKLRVVPQTDTDTDTGTTPPPAGTTIGMGAGGAQSFAPNSASSASPFTTQSGETVLLSTEPDENRGRTRRPRRRKPAEEEEVEEVPRNMGAFRRGAIKSNVKPSDQVSKFLGLTPYSNRQMITRKRNN